MARSHTKTSKFKYHIFWTNNSPRRSTRKCLRLQQTLLRLNRDSEFPLYPPTFHNGTEWMNKAVWQHEALGLPKDI